MSRAPASLRAAARCRARSARSPASPPASPGSRVCPASASRSCCCSRAACRASPSTSTRTASTSCCWATTPHLHAGQEVQRTGRVMDVAVGDALLGRVIDPLGRPLDGGGRRRHRERLPIERPAAADHGPRAGDRAAADRPEGHRRADSDRPRPARTDPRRPPDRQDGDRHRHHLQPARQGRAVRVLRDRPARVGGGQGGGDAAREAARWPTPWWSSPKATTRRAWPTSRPMRRPASPSTSWKRAATC